MGSYTVGPDAISQYKTLQDAFNVAETTGDTAHEFVLSGFMMVDQPAISGLSNVLIRAADPKHKPHLKSNREMELNNSGMPVCWSSGIAKGKGIIVGKTGANNWTFDGIELSGAYTGSDYNACGIFFPGINLTVKNCTIWDCQDGIRTADQPQSVINLENNVVYSCGYTGTGKAHNIYISPCKEVNIVGLRSYDAYLGHLLKLNLGDGIARIVDCDLIASDYNDTSSYCLDLNGGRVEAFYVRMRKGKSSSNMSRAVYYATNRGTSPSGNSLTMRSCLIESHCLHAGHFIDVVPALGDTVTGDISANTLRSVDQRWVTTPVSAPSTVTVHDNTAQLITEEARPPTTVTLANVAALAPQWAA